MTPQESYGKGPNYEVRHLMFEIREFNWSCTASRYEMSHSPQALAWGMGRKYRTVLTVYCETEGVLHDYINR